ncbi:C10 family peptidase [Bacteroidota bacterium]
MFYNKSFNPKVDWYCESRKIIAILLLSCISILLKGSPVDTSTVKTIAKNFFWERINKKIDYAAIRPEIVWIEVSNETALYFVVNINKKGHVIVSADNAVFPILSYSLVNTYYFENQIQPYINWMNNYKSQIIEIVDENYLQSPAILSEWQYYSDTGIMNLSLLAVSPLISTTWNQSCYYNELCPYDTSVLSGYCDHVPVGCVAAAMGLIMKYWNYPICGTGSNHYTHPNYGIQSANFDTTYYDWNNMPNSLSGSSTNAEIMAVATLLYHCGVSVNMNYGPNGSGAASSNVEQALTDYFYYDYEMVYKHKDSTSNWDSLVKNDLDNAWPLYYAGCEPPPNTGCHAFVLDGYQGSNNDYYHFNWGWGGGYNNYFYLNSLNPGTHNYTAYQHAYFKIHPSCQLAVNAGPDQVVCEGSNMILSASSSSGGLTQIGCTSNCAMPSTCTIASSNCNYEYITNISLNGGSQNSSASNYTSYTSNYLTTLFVDSTYTLSGTAVVDSGNHIVAYIDWNRNGIFESAESIVIDSTSTASSSFSFSKSITVPSNAVLGDAKLRIVIVWNTLPSPCNSFYGGEVEDYKIFVKDYGLGTYNYSWSGPDNFTSNSQNPSISNSTWANSGTYILTVTYGSSCIGIDDVNITINQLNANAGIDQTVCEGDTISLAGNGATIFSCTSNCTMPTTCTNSSNNCNWEYITNISLNGGSQNSSASNYSDYTSNYLTTLFVDSTYTLSGTAVVDSGNHIVAYFDWNRNGLFESGESIVIDSTSTASSSFSFSKSFTVPSNAVLGDAKLRIVIVWNTLPSPCNSFYGGEVEDYRILVKDYGLGANNYSWSGPNNFSSTTQNITIVNASIANSGTYAFTVTDTNACSAYDTAIILVNQNPNVNLGPDIQVPAYDYVTLDAGSGFDTYLWSNADTTQSIIVDSTGVGFGSVTYSVTVTLNGCTGDDDIMVTFFMNVGSDDETVIKSITIYPNPSKGLFTINIQGYSEVIDMKVHNNLGQILISEKLINVLSGIYVKEINMKEFHKGVYYITFTDGCLLKTEKIAIY